MSKTVKYGRRASDTPRRLNQEVTEGTAVVHEPRTLVCQATGEEFEWTPTGSGRPPLYSPQERARREAAKRAATPRKQAALRNIHIAGTPTEADQYVMRIYAGKNPEPWLVPSRVVSLEGDTAEVERTYDGEVVSVPVDKLRVIQVGT